MCLYPTLIRNRKYIPNKKNGGQVPPIPIHNGIEDKRVLFVPVGCGKCMECMRQKSNYWKVRLTEEFRINNNAIFVTLSFSDKSLDYINNTWIKDQLTGYDLDNEIATIAVRKFLERWRKKHKKSVRHWLVTELGGRYTERIHLHGILWTNDKNTLNEKWQYGNIHIGDYCNNKTINYIVKYLHKTDKKHKYYTPKIFSSAGIGKNYLDRIDAMRNKFNGEETKDNYITRQGFKLSLPTYYRNHLYNDDEKEILWLNMLDKNIRYVDKQKIDISNGYDDYFKSLMEARRKNTILGYHDNEDNWEKKIYENSLRNAGRKK